VQDRSQYVVLSMKISAKFSPDEALPAKIKRKQFTAIVERKKTAMVIMRSGRVKSVDLVYITLKIVC